MESGTDHLSSAHPGGSQALNGRRWTPVTILRRAADVLVNQGPAALFIKVLGELCYRRMFVYKEILKNDLDLPPSTIPLVVRELRQEELPRYLAHATRTSGQEVISRLDAGHICHVAWSEGVLAGYVWSASGNASIDYLGVAMQLPSGAVYGYEVFVNPQHRKSGVSIGIMRERRMLLLAAGYDTGYSALMPENTAAVGFHRAVKGIPIGTLRVAWLGPWRRSWLRPIDPAAAQPFGLSR